MTKTKAHQIGALVGLFALAACDESGTQALLDDLTPEEAIELAVLGDPGSLDVALELNSAANDVAASFGGPGVGEGRGFNVQAGVRFAAAGEALRAGDRRRALEEAREARRLLARAIVTTSGEDGVIALIERIEELALITAEDDDVFDNPEALRARLESLAAEARALLADGHLVAAAERALLGEQIARHHRGRRGHPGDILSDRARLAVSLAGTAVALAEMALRPRLGPMSALLSALVAVAAPALGAQTDVTVELGASQIGSPVGADAEISRFGVAGIRASHHSLTGSGFAASILGGRSIGDQDGGDFLSATLGSSMVEDWGGGWTAGMDLRLFGFGIRAPFPYRALAAEGGPMLQYRGGSMSVKEVVGHFTPWESVPMQRDGMGWVVDLEVEAGTHHYGYLVDGEWYLPEDQENVVPDEWGRMSAILVIEGEE